LVKKLSKRFIDGRLLFNNPCDFLLFCSVRKEKILDLIGVLLSLFIQELLHLEDISLVKNYSLKILSSIAPFAEAIGSLILAILGLRGKEYKFIRETRNPNDPKGTPMFL
jgi:hypothetical protein